MTISSFVASNAHFSIGAENVIFVNSELLMRSFTHHWPSACIEVLFYIVINSIELWPEITITLRGLPGYDCLSFADVECHPFLFPCLRNFE